MQFLRGRERANAEAKYGALLKALGMNANGLVCFSSSDGVKTMAVLETLVAAVPTAIEPIRQNVTREAPKHAVDAFGALINVYGTASIRLAGGKSKKDADRVRSKTRKEVRKVLGILDPDFDGHTDVRRVTSAVQEQITILDDISTACKRPSSQMALFLRSKKRRRLYQRGLLELLYRKIPILLEGSEDNTSLHISDNYALRSYLVPANHYKSWLCHELSSSRPTKLTQRLRVLPMPEFIYLLEAIRKYDISDDWAENDEPLIRIRGEVLLDPSWPEGRVLTAWMENVLYYPKDPFEKLNRPRSIYVRLLRDMKREGLDFENDTRYVVSWAENRREKYLASGPKD
jgi:hypothetical protein